MQLKFNIYQCLQLFTKEIVDLKFNTKHRLIYALYAIGKKKSPPHVQAHLFLLVPHKIKRAFTSPPPPSNNREYSSHFSVIIYTELLHL